MESAVIVTYRCNARCMMCRTWEHPSKSKDEFKPELLEKLPDGQERINLTGGEPALREDLEDIVRILDKKTKRLEISTNGFYTDRLVAIGKKFPHITFRVSVDGLPERHDRIRGIKNGFDHSLRTVLHLLDVGVKDVGMGIVISDENKDDLLDLYRLCARMNIEFTSSTMHNSFYFHKLDNKLEDPNSVEKVMKEFIEALLQSDRSGLKLRVKDWGRAYLNRGLLDYIMQRKRALPCGAATDLFFLDPWGKMLACNGSAEPWELGDLTQDDFDTIWNGPQAEAVRKKVCACDRGCWMVGTAVPAMRRKPLGPIRWILENKAKLARGGHL